MYKGLPACKGMTDDEIDDLTKRVCKRNPKLSVFPVLIWCIVLPLAMGADRLLSIYCDVDRIWAIIIVGVPVCLSVYLFNRAVHAPRVNRVMEEIIAEQSGGEVRD